MRTVTTFLAAVLFGLAASAELQNLSIGSGIAIRNNRWGATPPNAVKFEKVSYGGWANCVKLSNGLVELIATTDVGPRIIRYGFVDGPNVFKEYADQMGKSGGDAWNIYGGHRLWHAPEASPRTYALDNSPVQHEWNGSILRLTQPTEESTGIQKQIEIELAPDSSHVTVRHRLINRNVWDVSLAPWALTVMAPGGRGIFPQEEYKSHPEYLLPARPLVLWHYTDMTDPRWTWGRKYVQLQQDPKATTKQKFGFLNKQGWIAYSLNDNLFLKRYAFAGDAHYVDYGCNTESYTDADMLEMETVGPLSVLAANGGSVEHVEHWFLYRQEKPIGTDDAEIDASMNTILTETRIVSGK
ncbi:MAG: hypothetical protein AMXMBFR84_03650 [Candidatus Hydrogenedentota bacterium]